MSGLFCSARLPSHSPFCKRSKMQPEPSMFVLSPPLTRKKHRIHTNVQNPFERFWMSLLFCSARNYTKKHSNTLYVCPPLCPRKPHSTKPQYGVRFATHQKADDGNQCLSVRLSPAKKRLSERSCPSLPGAFLKPQFQKTNWQRPFANHPPKISQNPPYFCPSASPPPKTKISQVSCPSLSSAFLSPNSKSTTGR